MKPTHRFTPFFFLFLISCILAAFPSAHAASPAWQYERLWPALQQPWYFNLPNGIEIDRDGFVWVADTENHRIQKFTRDGQLVSQLGRRGDGAGDFWAPDDIAVDRDGYLYVADTLNQRIQKFSPEGDFLTFFDSAGEAIFLPSGIAADDRGSVYTVNADNKAVYRFTTEGRFVAHWGAGEPGGNADYNGVAVDKAGRIYAVDRDAHQVRKFSADGLLLDQWDAHGDGPGELDLPAGVAIGPEGKIFVADSNNDRVQVFSPDGGFLTQWGRLGTEDAAFNSTSGIAVDAAGGVYVGDWENQRIQKFTSDGRFLAGWKSRGGGNGEFYLPEDVALDAAGNVYVADKGNHRIQVFTPDGRFLRSWGSEGAGPGEFDLPYGLAVNGNVVYVADTNNHRIQKFDLEGGFVAQWGELGEAGGQFDSPSDVAVDGDGRIHVVDWYNNRIQTFTPDGDFIRAWGGMGADPGRFDAPFSIAVGPDGVLYVTDAYYNCRVQMFDRTGGYIDEWPVRGSGMFPCPGFSGIAAGPDGRVYFPDVEGGRVRVYSAAGESIGAIGRSGSGTGQLKRPRFVAVADDGRVVVSDSGNNRVQVFRPADADPKIAKAILVAGGGPYPGNHLWDATRMCLNFAYRALAFQGFAKEAIQYLSPDRSLDLDNNGEPDDVDGDATRENFRRAILEWAGDADQLTLYMADHGGSESFRLNDRETLSAGELSAWLDAFQAQIPAEVVVIYDACNAGSFLPALVDGRPRRIAAAGAGADEDAYFITQGAVSFSSFFWTRIFTGASVGAAFEGARAALGGTAPLQEPVMAAGSDMNPMTVFIGNGTALAGSAPVIENLPDERLISGVSQAALWVEATDPDGISRVWGVIRPPDYHRRSSDEPVIDLPTVELMPAGGDRFEGAFDGFTDRGTYTATYYVRDRKGNVSPPESSRISVETPQIRRAVIVAGAGGDPALDEVFFDAAAFACQALAFQGYGDADIRFLSSSGDRAEVDGPATKEALSAALTEWAAEETRDLLLHLVGPGDDGVFGLNADADLSMDVLDGWLDDLQAIIPGPVVVVGDADRSGSWLPLLTPDPGRERFLIAGTPAGAPALFMAGGDLSFSHFFWKGVLNGLTLRRSFGDAAESLAFAGVETAGGPVLDDTGNGIGNESGDGVRAGGYVIGAGIRVSGNDPTVGVAPPDVVLSGDPSFRIYAEDVGGVAPVVRVRAVIRPPGDEASAALVAVPLQAAGEGRYAAVYDGFVGYGDYVVSIYAEDADGNASPAKAFSVRQTLGPDAWEPDDEREGSGVIDLNADGPMIRNFHEGDGADWVRMMGLEGVIYSVAVEYQGPGCRARMEMVDAEGEPVFSRETAADDDVLRHDWECKADGVYFLKLTNMIDKPGEDAGYALRLFRPIGPFAGFLKGRATDAETGDPIVMARIQTDAGASALSRPDGRYLIIQEPGTATVAIEADAYDPETLEGVVVSEGGTTLRDFRLMRYSDPDPAPDPPGEDVDFPAMEPPGDVGGACFIGGALMF